ncbi:MAG: hypothetical protein AB7S26_34410 [Sandaracinaceae bacterium]
MIDEPTQPRPTLHLRVLAAGALALGVGCGSGDGDRAPEATTESAPSAAPIATGATPVAGEIAPGAPRAARNGGTVLAVGPYVLEVVTHDDGALEATVDDLAEPAGAQLIVRLPTEQGSLSTVLMTWDPATSRFRGRLREGLPVPGPLAATLTVNGERHEGRSGYTIILPPEAQARIAGGSPTGAPTLGDPPVDPSAAPPTAPASIPGSTAVDAPRPAPLPRPPHVVRVSPVAPATAVSAEPPQVRVAPMAQHGVTAAPVTAVRPATATPTATPTATVRPAATVRPTATVQPSATVRPAAAAESRGQDTSTEEDPSPPRVRVRVRP